MTCNIKATPEELIWLFKVYVMLLISILLDIIVLTLHPEADNLWCASWRMHAYDSSGKSGKTNLFFGCLSQVIFSRHRFHPPSDPSRAACKQS